MQLSDAGFFNMINKYWTSICIKYVFTTWIISDGENTASLHVKFKYIYIPSYPTEDYSACM
jgi:hypothetical protein